MNAIANGMAASSENDFLFDRIESLPSELKDRIISTALFSEPLGSHAALHNIQLLSRGALYPRLRERVTILFKSQYLRKQIDAHWQLYRGFEHAKRSLYSIDKTSQPDLASWAVSRCYHRCFRFLLGHGSIPASCFCRTGDSFLFIAMKNGNTEAVEHIVSLMAPEHLSQPCSLQEPEITAIQHSTQQEVWFQACWKKARLRPDMNFSSSLNSYGIANIAQYACVNLAIDLLKRGVDLGQPFPGSEIRGWWAHEFPGWWGVLAQKNPVPMLDWFWRQGHRPPADFLLFVAAHSFVAATSWVLRQIETYEYQDWQEAAYLAAENTDSRSVEMLELIHQHRKSEWRTSDIFTQNLAIRVIDEVCRTIQSQRQSGPRDQSHIDGEHSAASESEILQLENVAVLKIRYLQSISDRIEVVGLKVKSRRNGLHQLAAAMESMDS